MAAIVKSVYPLQSGKHSGHTFIDILLVLVRDSEYTAGKNICKN